MVKLKGKKKHLHKYKRDILGRAYVIYKCTIPGCTHYIPDTLLINRLALCGNCEEPFVIDKEATEMAIPRCKNCITRKNDLTDLEKAIEDRLQ